MSVSLVGGDIGGGGCIGGEGADEGADEGIDGTGGGGIPHPSSRTVFFFLRGDASRVCWISFTPPPWIILLLDGDILTPPPLPTSRSS